MSVGINKKSASTDGRLLTEERRREILALLEANGRVRVDELVRRFGVSAVTVRADLDELSNFGALKRSHGGAVRAGPVHDFPIRMKEVIHHAEKVRIAQYAAGLIQPGHTIVLDSGSTTAEIARQLKLNRPGPLTIITNSLDNAFELAEVASVNLIMIGGILRHISRSFVGPQAEQIIRELHADHLFLGVDAIDPEIGPSTPDILEAQLNGLMIRAAKQVSVVADSSKFGRVSLSVIAPVQKVNRVITDTGIDAAMADSFRRQNIEVITV